MKASGVYLAYLLRIWCIARDGETLWQASIEDVDTGERRGFPSLETLFAHLRDETRSAQGFGPPDGAAEERGNS